jgi:undecaprenyl-diphosphatase
VVVWFNQYAQPTVTEVARAILSFGSVGWLTTLSISIALFFVLRRERLNLFLFTLVMSNGGARNVFLKHLFHRERLVLENPLVTLSSYGFPSGDTMGATLFYGLLALLVWRNIGNRTGRVACLIAPASRSRSSSSPKFIWELII